MRALGALTIFVALLAPAFADVEQNSTETRTFAGVDRVVVDNVWGSIDVSGSGGAAATVEIAKSVRADSNERAEAAGREVKLEISQSGGTLRIYVDGPFRCSCRDGSPGLRWEGHRGSGYRVKYDFRLQVPSGASLDLATVNEGRIEVDHITGDFDVNNVNGGIEMTDIAGSGSARTINGPVKVSYTRNPARATSFETLNGDVDVTFRPGLNVDVRMSTRNGGMYTDYEVKPLPVQVATERRDGKFVLHAAGGIRIGSGGIDLALKTFNGNIFIREKQ
jgi:hypothetical protein